jgi:hypothetical protein
LQLEWDYPVYAEPEEKSSGTTAKRQRRALAVEAAYAFIAGDDPRPLLVLRECKQCNGTDTALLQGGPDNERTQLLARWFHCVKLPVDVREPDHPFNALFPREDAEHLFVSAPDGSGRVGLESEGSRTEIWKAMGGVISAEYAKKADASMKRIAMLLDDLDVVDSRRREVQLRRDEILQEDGPESSKLKKIERDLGRIDAELQELHEEIAEASVLELKRANPGEQQPAKG